MRGGLAGVLTLVVALVGCGGAEAFHAGGAGAGAGGGGGGRGPGIDAAAGAPGAGGRGGSGGDQGGAGAGGLGAGGAATDARVDAPGGSGGGTTDAGRADGSAGGGGAPVDAGRGGSGGSSGGGGGGGRGGQGGAPPPVVIGIDFVGAGVPMAATETAGVLPAIRWNSAAAASGSLAALVESSGTASAAAVTWSADNVWVLPVADAPGNARMMNGYLDPFYMATVDVTALPAALASGGYDVYVYANGDVTAGDTRTAVYAIGAVSQTVTQAGQTPFSGTFVQAVAGGMGNYVVFRGLTGAAFTLTATVGTGNTRRAPLNGLQIVTAGAGP